MATASGSKLGRRHAPCPICKKNHSPWWNSEKGAWYLSLPTEEKGKYRKISLGDDHDKAIERWHKIEAGLELVQPTTTTDGILVGELVNLFLDAESSRLTADRFRNTKRFLEKFAEGFGAMSVAAMRVGGVPKIEKWIDSHKTWCGCRADVVQRIRRLFNWATENNYIAGSPVRALKKPKYGVRVSSFSAEQEAAILDNGNAEFARGFRMLILTGCRPEEVCGLTDANVHDDSSGFYLLVDHKNQRHTNKQRRIFLVPEAAKIIREQLKKYPNGQRLFRSGNKTDGGFPPLSVEYFCHAMRSVCKKPACKKLSLNDCDKIGGKRQFRYVPYTCRHTFAVRYLTGYYRDADGKPIILNYGEVAALLGNSAKMVEQIYGHLVDQTKFLSNRLQGLA